MLIVTLLACGALLFLGAGALLAMVGTVALVVGVGDPKFDPRHVKLAATAIILAGLALFIAGSYACLELIA